MILEPESNLEKLLYQRGNDTYLVINIGDVHDKLDVELEVIPEDSTQDIGADIVSGMTQMRIVVDCRTASVPLNFPAFGVQWHKGRLRSGEGVPYFEGGQTSVGMSRGLLPGRLLATLHDGRAREPA